LRHAPRPIKRIEARRKLWSPYLQALAGTGYELAFRRAVSQAARPTPGQDRRGPATRRAGLPRPPAVDVRAQEAAARPTAALAAAHERS
jgi:hypothetical protein